MDLAATGLLGSATEENQAKVVTVVAEKACAKAIKVNPTVQKMVWLPAHKCS